MKTTIEDSNTKLENKLKEFEEAVEEDKSTATKIKVPTCDGKVSCNTYLRQFEAVVRNWREEEKATSLIAALRGEALEVLRTISEGSQDYGDAHQQHVYQAQLRNRKQRFEETLQQYEADVSRMVNLAFPTAPAEVIEQLSVSSFVDGLRDPEISQLVRLARHKTISEAFAYALKIETAKQASRGTSKIRQVKAYHGKDRMATANGNLADIIIEVIEKYKKGQD
ncbi:hypothetical protein NQ315_008902 [Exocentrus adspersus]|uniref:Uncharacterized protein n=1 Tax=Exocentrus adspersus TaxID=1586481 RepID=A0AAV8V6F3_9CUCU|nr:hypothetical protein NQ315_008902 [Exocentrus adspersus]